MKTEHCTCEKPLLRESSDQKGSSADRGVATAAVAVAGLGECAGPRCPCDSVP